MATNATRSLVDGAVRPCRTWDIGDILRIINAAAAAYRGIIPADRWHEPYMSAPDLDAEMDAGVAFSWFEAKGGPLGVMGLQRKGDVDLIRHAYVLPGHQRGGIGAALLDALCRDRRTTLVGTWQAADWAIRFYHRHGFRMVAEAATGLLLETFWTVPARQVETSVVLAKPALTASDAVAISAAFRMRSEGRPDQEAPRSPRR